MKPRFVEVEWPDKVLNPNHKCHWAVKAKHRKFQSQEAWSQVWGFHPITRGKIALDITFHPPTRRSFDLDNALSSMKGALDGLAKAWKVDDKHFEPITIRRGEPVTNGKVLIKYWPDEF